MGGLPSNWRTGKKLTGFEDALPQRTIFKIPSPFEEDEMIPITVNRFECICLSDRYDVQTIVERRDFNRFGQHKWRHVYTSKKLDNCEQKKLYAARDEIIDGVRVRRWLHREILELAEGPAPSPYHVGDHID